MDIDGLEKRKRRGTDWQGRRTRVVYCLLPATDSLERQRHRQAGCEGWGETLHTNSNKNRAGVTSLASDETDLRKETKMDIRY